MATRTQVWHPDTCGCVIDELCEGSTIVGPGRVLKKCPPHAAIADEDLYGVLYANPDGENRRKNRLLRMLLGHDNPELNLGLSELRPAAGGRQALALREGVEFSWSFSGEGRDRVLHVSVPGAGLSAAKKSALQGACDIRFGAGKVQVT